LGAFQAARLRRAAIGTQEQKTFAALFFETKRPLALPLDGLN
jgi:hypothetical protein